MGSAYQEIEPYRHGASSFEHLVLRHEKVADTVAVLI